MKPRPSLANHSAAERATAAEAAHAPQSTRRWFAWGQGVMKRTAYSRRHALFIGTALLITAAVITGVRLSSSSPAPVYFHTLPPGARLPAAAECARLVRASPSSESRPVNTRFNRTVGHQVPSAFFPAGDSPQAKKLAPRISGAFTGTTKEILRWAACKWGIDQDVVFAQAAVESWWRQVQFGDWAADPKLCPPGHGIGADGKPGQCPQSYGILQNRYPFEEAAWPGIGTSTAMNADAAYAIWRSCYDGYEIWLNNQPRSRPYHAGDLWGCVGRWFAGNWYTPVAERYIRSVKKYLGARIWLQSSFAQGG
jgi:hypothetical protein